MSANSTSGAFLKLLSSPTETPPYPLSTLREVVLGRAPECQIVLDPTKDVGVSRRHASVRPLASGRFEVCDLGSANGTYVNGNRLEGCQVLKSGDRIQLGIDGPAFRFESFALPLTRISSHSATLPANTTQPTVVERNASRSPSHDDPGRLPLPRNLLALRKAVQFGISGAIGGFSSDFFMELVWRHDLSLSLLSNILSTGIWFGVIGAGIATAIVAGYHYYINRRFQIAKAFKDVALSGLVAGAIAGAIAEAIYSSIGPTEVLRAICWGIAGGLLGVGLSRKLPNLGRSRGLVGGSIGGVLGGCIFILLTYTLSQVLGRLFGCAAIGFCIGLMLVVIETLFSKAWLAIDYDDGSTRRLNIGREPLTVGSDEALSIISVRDAPPLALRFTLEQGQIICEDVPIGTKKTLHPGQTRRVGNCTLTVGGAATSLEPRE